MRVCLFSTNQIRGRHLHMYTQRSNMWYRCFYHQTPSHSAYKFSASFRKCETKAYDSCFVQKLHSGC